MKALVIIILFGSLIAGTLHLGFGIEMPQMHWMMGCITGLIAIAASQADWSKE